MIAPALTTTLHVTVSHILQVNSRVWPNYTVQHSKLKAYREDHYFCIYHTLVLKIKVAANVVTNTHKHSTPTKQVQYYQACVPKLKLRPTKKHVYDHHP